ncbi:MAG TPA: protein phosphatase 2C domain-containing protein [Gemmatimonadales bacterium]|nr:protein phosphatase 2C domain-containing protein [Gemmatimonadales bacterium]
MTHSLAAPVATERKPRDDEIDVYGLTHPGKVRKDNQDHFLICSLRPGVFVHHTSLPDTARWTGAERLAFLAMVADGVGGSAMGEEASRAAVAEITDYVTQCVHTYYTAYSSDDAGFADALVEAAMQVHARVVEQTRESGDRGGSTTLTLWIGVWPRAYLLHVGDSRCYTLRNGVLTQISRDQTMAQELLEAGVLSRTEARRTRWAHILSSSIGGQQTAPVVTRMDQVWGTVGLLCSDGLTKHVSDERIAERLRTMTSARQVCEALLEDALEDGGSDNITILVGRAVRKDLP